MLLIKFCCDDMRDRYSKNSKIKMNIEIDGEKLYKEDKNNKEWKYCPYCGATKCIDMDVIKDNGEKLAKA